MRPEHPVCTLNPGGGRGREHQAICSLPLLPPPPRPLPSARLTAAAPPPGMSDSVKDKFSVTFSIVGMFASHAAGSLSVFFCAEITPTVIRCVAGPPGVGGLFRGRGVRGGPSGRAPVDQPPALASGVSFQTGVPPCPPGRGESGESWSPGPIWAAGGTGCRGLGGHEPQPALHREPSRGSLSLCPRCPLFQSPVKSLAGGGGGG